CVLLGHITGHWEPEFLLFAWGFKYLFFASNANQVINVIKCSFLNFFVDILFLTVEIHLPLQLYITHFFASGQTCEIGRGANTYFPHCIIELYHCQHKLFVLFYVLKNRKLMERLLGLTEWMVEELSRQ